MFEMFDHHALQTPPVRRRRSELLSEGLEVHPSQNHASTPATHAVGAGDGLANLKLQNQETTQETTQENSHENSQETTDFPTRNAPSPRSLKTRAVYYLSKREHSRAELAKKLSQPSFQARRNACVRNTELPEAPSSEQIEAVLNDLQRQGFLDDARFAQGLARKNASKHGAARVMASMGQHKLDAATTQPLALALKDSELPRCYAVWAKRFSHINCSDMAYPEAQAALGKQGRFLMQRGFNGEAVKKVLNGWVPERE